MSTQGEIADSVWRTARRGALRWMFTLLFITVAFSICAGKRYWDKLVVDERMRAAGLTTQPALASTLEFAARMASFEAVLYFVGAVVTATLAFFSFRRFDRLRRDFRIAVGRCMNCGYELEGLGEPRCPECGTPFSVELLQSREAQDPPESRPA